MCEMVFIIEIEIEIEMSKRSDEIFTQYCVSDKRLKREIFMELCIFLFVTYFASR